MQRVLSGMQASGRLHLGNLVGALQNWVALQDRYECFYFVADWHALTTGYAHPEDIKDSTRDVLVNYIAAGLDPERSTLHRRGARPGALHPLSPVPHPPALRTPPHAEHDNPGGLQTADIVIYKADFVPVGEDQVPHLEISREIVRRFNHLYKEVFPEPQPLLTKFPKVPGVDGRKMSKSYDNAVYLSDEPDTVEKKIKTMMTDPARVKRTDKGDPEKSPVYHLHKIFSSEEEVREIAEWCATAGIGCIDCKKVLIKNVRSVMEPIWEKRNELLKNPSRIEDIIRLGTEKATKVAEETMDEVRETLGFGKLW
jgi:tryptophanyl-tRNA synthetase